MRSCVLGVVGAILLACVDGAEAGGRYLEVSYPPSSEPGTLQLGVTYTLWIPERVEKIRAIIVHQHGCGEGACQGGATAAYDLHWQALARRWDCALLGPSYHQTEDQSCRLWCDPRNGSYGTFLSAIERFAADSAHPELQAAPWCLWGHSGGGFWASIVQTLAPERTVAVWLRSGTAFATWEKGDIPKPDIPEAAYAIPTMCNPGAKEKRHERFNGAWAGTLAMFKAYRGRGAPIGFAPDPRTAHECGDSRYLAIPFFDACLAMRLPDTDSPDQRLLSVDEQQAWLAPLLGDSPRPAASYDGPKDEAVWLPNERVAKAWAEYVTTGAASDATPPPPPTDVRATATPDGKREITWQAEADFESGIQAFRIQRDGRPLAQVPEKPIGRFGRPLFQRMSYHDTPEKPLPEMRFVDASAEAGKNHEYRVITINGVGLSSDPSVAASAE